jgi:hypothetical protein
MTGGFPYPLSPLKRATQAVRQPGSAIKPLSYLAALGNGLQPNTLISDDSITLPPIGGGRAREQIIGRRRITTAAAACRPCAGRSAAHPPGQCAGHAACGVEARYRQRTGSTSLDNVPIEGVASGRLRRHRKVSRPPS